MPHRLIKPGFEPLGTASLGAGTIRNMIENFGFTEEIHGEEPRILGPVTMTTPLPVEVTQMPGVDQRFVAGPGTIGFDPIPNLNRFTAPAGIVAPDWREMIRVGIETWMTGSNPFQQEGPLVLPEQSPTPGVFPPGGLQNPMPQLIARSGGRTPFITMPNGLPGCPTGYHPEKQGRPYCVRNRRMNPLNPRALSRATRRVGGFARAVKRARTLKRICRTL